MRSAALQASLRRAQHRVAPVALGRGRLDEALLEPPHGERDLRERVLLDRGEPGFKLLAELIEILRDRPQHSVAALLERYRDTPEGAILERLAAWEPEAPAEGFQFDAEFADILTYLRRRADPRGRLPDILLRRGAPSALSAEEREALRNLGKPQKI